MEAMAPTPAQTNPARPSSSRGRSLVDLPQEVQAEIISHCSKRDLICVALVSKRFRDLAAAQLYREFRIVFPDEDNPQFDTPVDPLASGLETFVTSDHNYAQYLRKLDFDTLHMGDKAVVGYRPYLANLSCGKFMNTLLLLTLRKARSLETFKWNVRVELSRPVYQELHRLTALSHLHIRLQAGPSQYEAPPPLPYDAPSPTSPPAPAHATPIPVLPPPQPGIFGLVPPPPPAAFYVPASTAPPPPLPKPPRARAPKKASLEKEPPTLSGFTKLKSLAVLDIDDLDLVPEIQTCVRNSAGTLTKLKLSFSEKLASSARKPQVDHPEPEDSDQEDELIPLPAHSHSQGEELSGPARAFRAQEERKTQESVLGRIFGIESTPAETLQPVIVEVVEKKRKVKSEQEVIDFMKTYAPRFMGELNDTADFAVPQDILDMIGTAAQRYLEEAKAHKEKQDEEHDDSAGSAEPSDGKADEASAESGEPEVSLFSEATSSSTAKEDHRNVSPEDINIEEPEEQLAIEPEDPPADEAPLTETDVAPAEAALANTKSKYGKVLATLESKKEDYQVLAEKLELFETQVKTFAKEIGRWRDSQSPVDLGGLADAESNLLGLTQRVRDMQKEVSACQVAIAGAEALAPGAAGSHEDEAGLRHMREYVRETRGIALQSLSICLIPVRASVLSKAVDLRALRSLTLLNVGIQAPIWSLLLKENAEAPLPLRKIFTDNVSWVFLKCVASLAEVHELFLHEPRNKARPESFAPPTQTTIDQIRRTVLKKHTPTLRRLMIKNCADRSWDMNEKAVLMLCRQGGRLEELSCNMTVRAMHCLMQHISGLTSLRALHVVHMRNDDNCMWAIRETKRFLIDNVSHYPHLKLEWLAIDEDDRADRLIRVTDWDRKYGGEGGKSGAAGKHAGDKKGKGKDKGKGGLTITTTTALGAFGSEEDDVHVNAVISAVLGEDDASNNGSSTEDDGASESSEDEDEGFFGQKIETVDGIAFWDVEGVKIFKKEIIAGRL